MTLSEFLHAAADAVAGMEPEALHPYSGEAYAAAEALLLSAEEAQQ